jgi:glucose-6-phosphate 1-dehydrogenase
MGLVADILEDWSKTKPGNFPNCASGSDGPAEADALLARDSRSWRPVKEQGR